MSVSSAPRKKPAPAQAPPATVADLLKRLAVPAARVRLCPPVGTATELDLIAVNGKKEGLVELVDGVLVEKAIGFDESNWTALLLFYVCDHVVLKRDLGKVYGPDCGYRLAPGLVRLPSGSFLSWDRHRELKRGAQLSTVPPDLAADVLRLSNTRREIERKLTEYFAAGVRLAWIVDPKRREVRVHASPADFIVLTATDVLDGGDVLPGFRLPLAEFFDQAEREGPAS